MRANPNAERGCDTNEDDVPEDVSLKDSDAFHSGAKGRGGNVDRDPNTMLCQGPGMMLSSHVTIPPEDKHRSASLSFFVSVTVDIQY